VVAGGTGTQYRQDVQAVLIRHASQHLKRPVEVSRIDQLTVTQIIEPRRRSSNAN
jgi:hypothetical protein